MGFLLQMIRDAELYLTIKTKPSSEQQILLEQLTSVERYWYAELFPRWLASNDPRFLLWRGKLMAGEYTQNDSQVIRAVAAAVKQRGGCFWECYIADLSMATDLIVGYRQNHPLCIQLTSQSDEYSQQKYQDWQQTLQNWKIERGLFLSYNPGEPNFIDQLANLALHHSDHLEIGTYLKLP
ncbi:hypothetical protein K9N68_07030 [Kovacikia minuta CCNUW1]|uniref:hypothetical protein n=1 Tax=Kovacikia minuta TaxID=2931930 RepID=UPI001CC9B0A2|nr:hypothetical protein [Kovacikia minuta]UBF27666.1 hypothetical protein K9N68_07030 [Kovacikia minuta CCNUW1]